MSKIERFQGDVKAFASNAQGLERTVFGGTTQANDLTSQVTAAFLRGWGIVGPSEHPSLEDFNAAMFAMSQFIAYQHQIGTPEWHTEQEYYTGSVCTHGGVSYQSLIDDNVGNEPPSAQWTPVLTAKSGGEAFQPKNGNLTALAALAGAANKLPFFTGAGAMANTDLTAAGRELISKSDVAAILTYLGLGDVVRDTRTINGKRLNEDITLTATELGIGQATESTPGLLQISDAINANDSRVAASSAAVYKLLPKRAYTDNDFIRVPDTSGGLMIQWGRLQSGEGANFSTPFTNACRFCIVIPQNGSSGPFDMAYLYTRSYDKQGFLRSAATSGTPCFWLAIGY